MQRKIFKQFNKQILCILILFVMIYTMFGFIPSFMNKSYGATYTYSGSLKNLPKNFDTMYPGYRTLLESLVKAHPNWTFKLYETNLEWEAVINNEYQGHSKKNLKNLVPKTYSDPWICPICGKKTYDTQEWYCASKAAIEYTMDPRTSMQDTKIFQYLLLSNDENITKEQVETMAKKISYLNDQKIIDAIYEVANDPEYDINPFFIIGKILQEQGSGASALCSGQGYKNQYVGYYNLFNVGATGNTLEEVILNGLEYAKKQGWDTPHKAIMGGIGLIRTYINRGQDTLYYQKFNVTSQPYYSGQYAQNIFDAQSIGKILRGYYKEENLLDSEFIFEIPLYKNMPQKPVSEPKEVVKETGENAYINANGGLKLKDMPNGNTIRTIAEGTKILITQRADKKVGDYYWDKVSTPYGTGYMARESSDGNKTYLVVITEEEEKEEDKENNIDKEEEKKEPLAKGDCNGDGKVDSMDMYNVIQHILKNSILKDKYFTAADTNKDSKIDSMDMYNIIQIILKS